MVSARIATLCTVILGCGPPFHPRAQADVAPGPSLDADGDNVLGEDDSCPDEPETYNGVVDDDGCPDTSASGAPSASPQGTKQPVQGPSRPADCVVFRRLLSPAAQLEHWVVLAERNSPAVFLANDDINRLRHVIDVLGVDVTIVGIVRPDESADLGAQRARQLQQALLADVTRPTGVRLGPTERQSDRGGATFRVPDGARGAPKYSCVFPRGGEPPINNKQ
jgi:hypothetical protein